MLRLAKRKEARLACGARRGRSRADSGVRGDTSAKKRPPAVSLSFDPISSFTPANADPKLAAALAGKALSLADFKFTPAPAKGRPSQVRVAIRARVVAPRSDARLAATAPTTAVNALTPTSYNLGVAVGWRRFAVVRRCRQGQESRSGARRPRERGRRRQLFAEALHRPRRRRRRAARSAIRCRRCASGDNVSLDVGGSYSLSRHIALTGGVRYNVERDRMSALQDDRRDSQAVYIGTAFKF